MNAAISGPLQRLDRRVDEERPAERRVLTGLHRLGRRDHGARSAVDRHELQHLGVLLVVGEAEVRHAALGAGHALDRDVVVLGGLVVGPADALLTVDGFGEVVERSRVSAGAEELQGNVGEARIDLVPVVDRAALVPDHLQLLHREAVRPVVLRVHDHCESVVRHLDLDPLDAGVRTQLLLVRLDLARGVVGVGLAGAELLEAAARAGDADGDTHVGVLRLEELCSGLGERTHGARSVDADIPRERGTATAGVWVVAPAGHSHQRDRQYGCDHREPTYTPHCSSCASPW